MIGVGINVNQIEKLLGVLLVVLLLVFKMVNTSIDVLGYKTTKTRFRFQKYHRCSKWRCVLDISYEYWLLTLFGIG